MPPSHKMSPSLSHLHLHQGFQPSAPLSAADTRVCWFDFIFARLFSPNNASLSAFFPVTKGRGPRWCILPPRQLINRLINAFRQLRQELKMCGCGLPSAARIILPPGEGESAAATLRQNSRQCRGVDPRRQLNFFWVISGYLPEDAPTCSVYCLRCFFRCLLALKAPTRSDTKSTYLVFPSRPTREDSALSSSSSFNCLHSSL